MSISSTGDVQGGALRPGSTPGAPLQKQESEVEERMLVLPKCELCKRYQIENNREICEAFPDGIPDHVMWESYEKECNNGIKFEENE